MAISQFGNRSMCRREFRREGVQEGWDCRRKALPPVPPPSKLGNSRNWVAKYRDCTCNCVHAITCAGDGHAPCRLPHAQHALTTFGSSVPHDSCHPLPAVPLDVHHLWALYMLHVPYISLKPGASVHLDEFTRGELPVGLIMS